MTVHVLRLMVRQPHEDEISIMMMTMDLPLNLSSVALSPLSPSLLVSYPKRRSERKEVRRLSHVWEGYVPLAFFEFNLFPIAPFFKPGLLMYHITTIKRHGAFDSRAGTRAAQSCPCLRPWRRARGGGVPTRGRCAPCCAARCSCCGRAHPAHCLAPATRTPSTCQTI
jgi:hypothetical protein